MKVAYRRPCWYWFGWGTLWPISRGHDEYGYRTVLLGWTITGRIWVAYRWCGRPDCLYSPLGKNWNTPEQDLLDSWWQAPRREGSTSRFPAPNLWRVESCQTITKLRREDMSTISPNLWVVSNDYIQELLTRAHDGEPVADLISEALPSDRAKPVGPQFSVDGFRTQLLDFLARNEIDAGRVPQDTLYVIDMGAKTLTLQLFDVDAEGARVYGADGYPPLARHTVPLLTAPSECGLDGCPLFMYVTDGKD